MGHPRKSADKGFRYGAGWLRLAVACCLGLMLAACAAPRPLLERSQDTELRWPPRPERAKVEWVKSIAVPEDAGISKGFWRKALELVTGGDLHRIVKPYGVLYDAGARLIIADPGAGMVHVMDTKAGHYQVVAGAGGLPLRSPIGLAEDDKNNLYITDSVNDAVYRYDLVQHTLTPFVLALERPTGIAFNPVNKLLYISETGANDVIAVDLKGSLKLRFSNAGTAATAGMQLPFNRPTDVAVDFKGQVFVTDPLNYKIRIFTPEGFPVTQFGEMGDARSELNKPKGIAVDGVGRIYVCDAMQDLVKVFDDGGNLLFSFGGTGGGPGGLWMPSGIFIYQQFIFVADTYNQRVQIFKMLGPDQPGPDEESSADYQRVSLRMQ